MSEEAKSAAMPTDLKMKNRINILDVFRKEEELSINEIAGFTGISRQTVVKSINFFLEKGLIISLGKGSSTEIGGKRPELYNFNSGFKHIFCAIIGAREVAVSLIDLKRNVLCEKSFFIRQAESIESIASKIGEKCKEISEKCEIDFESVKYLGVCTSGIYDKKTGIMRYNSIFPHWGEEIPMLDIFKKIFSEDCTIIIDNEAKASGLAELVKKEELKEKSILTIYTSEGIAAALIRYGDVYYGKNSLIGEVGHITIENNTDAKCSCGLTGCFESMVKEDVLLNMYPEKGVSLEEIFMRAESGDIKAREIVLYIAEYFATAIRNMILLTDPDIIIIQGKFANAGESFVNIIKDKMREFKYFGKNAEFDIRLNKDSLKDLCTTGIAEMIIRDLFSDENIYK